MAGSGFHLYLRCLAAYDKHALGTQLGGANFSLVDTT